MATKIKNRIAETNGDTTTQPEKPAAEKPAPEKIKELKSYYQKMHQREASRISIAVELVTPEMATAWLARNTHNRALKESVCSKYINYIHSREWTVNGEGVIIDETDNLLDGQHRLEAICRSGIPIPLMVVYGVNKDAFSTLNTGVTRSLADLLHIHKEENEKTLAGMLRLIATDRQGGLPSGRGKSRWSNQALRAILMEHPECRQCVKFTLPLCKRGIHPPTAVAFVFWKISTKYPEEATPFFTRVLTQEGIVPNSAESVLNRWLVNNSNSGRGSYLVSFVYVAAWIKAFNAFVEGRAPHSIAWKVNEAFPEVT